MRIPAPLCELPDLLDALAAELGPARARLAGPGGAFSLVEHAWHLADLEAEAYAVRVARLLDAPSDAPPRLADFDGDAVARARRYRQRALGAALTRFRAARADNLARLAAAAERDAARAGILDGVGRVTLGELAIRMLHHDRSHAAELVALARAITPSRRAGPAARRLERWAAGVPAAPCRGHAAPGGDPSWAPRVREIVRANLARGPELAEVARALHTSPRTLQRRLAEVGTSFRCLADELRQLAVLDALRDPTRSLPAVAAAAGWSPRVLVRAFRRWTGRSPTGFRRAITAGCAP